ncbi:DUF742 domain-containing protein [Streptomyces qinzhouensis]|uniref:DUF742 domain-containing protein n=1 Tax=Streptomyces qinzhouensis TaxID=2599401 RepID=A0A5B8JA75_9ACTN|nr:DUF742 domain-containing protein [Streptomyces qinzhouensis]QDY77334.1 DUF742 domain-containing protein [Streptomyces qinzhouensis]
MTARRGGRPLVPAYLSTGGQTRPGTDSLERLSILTGLVRPGAPAAGAADPAPAPPGRTAPEHGVPLPPPAGPGPALPPGLPAAQWALLDILDGGSLTLVEVAALLGLPVSAVRVLAARLIERGLVHARPPIPCAALPAPDLLKRVVDGLRALKL